MMFLMALVASISLYAQDLSFLRGERKIDYQMDWSHLTVNGMDVEDWILARQAQLSQGDAREELESELKPQVLQLVEYCNNHLLKEGMYLTPSSEEARYIMRIETWNVDRHGNTSLMIVFLNKATGREIVRFPINGNGVVAGPMPIRWARGMRTAGRTLGKLIRRQI